jgi:hypothetical protein
VKKEYIAGNGTLEKKTLCSFIILFIYLFIINSPTPTGIGPVWARYPYQCLIPDTDTEFEYVLRKCYLNLAVAISIARSL